MLKRRLSIRLVALAVALAGAWPAFAADVSDLPPLDPPDHWHVLTQDDATSDSKCIGNPVTPLCAVETIRACFLRISDELCRIGMGRLKPPGLVRGKAQPAESERYRIVMATKVDAANRKKLAFDDFHPDVGDIVIASHDRPCFFDKCGVTASHPTAYQVRKGAAGWRVVDWATPREN